MYVKLHHPNYGFATATYGDYVAISDPSLLRNSGAAATTESYSGSIDYFRYNNVTDQHDLIGTLHLDGINLEAYLARETGSDVSVRDPLHTELGVIETSDKDLLIDKGYYTNIWEDGLGISLDMYAKLLVAGVPYYSASIKTNDYEYSVAGALVDIYDLEKTEENIDSDPFVFSINNPDSEVTDSFGVGVTINSSWLAVGSPYASSSVGMVYMYQNTSTGSGDYNWVLYQKLNSPNPTANQQFGKTLKLNKQPGSFSGSLIVGGGFTSSNEAYYFEYVSSSWTHTYTFRPTDDILPLTFGSYPPYLPTMSLSGLMSVNGGFGCDVSVNGTTVIIGDHTDRQIYEFTGSQQYRQGAVYIFELCTGVSPTCFRLSLKTNGDQYILRNNLLGFSVDVFGNYAVAGSPKMDVYTLDPCYLYGTLGQLHYCDQDLEDSLNGQAMLLQRNTSSQDWEIVNIYQKRKRFLSPHRSFGFDVSLDGKSMVVGAPIYYSGSRKIQIETTRSNEVDVDDISGKSYIYNLHNLRDEFHVGNVFYRDGKIVIMTSGSAFEGIFLNSPAWRKYEYDLKFKGERTIHEKQIMCTVEPGEFNVSTNPTSIIYATSSMDLNKNGVFDFQDADVILRYMQYKINGTTDWSSSVITNPDEMSFYEYNASLWKNTSTLWSSSFYRFENIDTTFLDTLDINYDSKVNADDIGILWKYFCNRLTDSAYAEYVNVNCRRHTVNDATDYLDFLSKRTELPQILPEFFNYDRLSATDKTGSFLAPVVTTIGLYQGLDLVAVAKLGAPIKLPKTLPINFVVKMDF